MKKTALKPVIVPIEIIQSKIYLIRNQKVMLDSDLEKLYDVPTKSLNLAVKRNLARFPSDFMIKLTPTEVINLRFQNETSSWGGRRHLPYGFTQEGIAMLSSILNSERAIQVNIQIMRVFTKLREMMISHKDLARKIEDLERRFQDHDIKIAQIFEAIRQLMASPQDSLPNPYKRTKVGFIADKNTQKRHQEGQ
jgi:phage regulator Rha-like protein